MVTPRIEDIRERDTLEVMREIEAGRASETRAPEAPAAEANPQAGSPDPADLLVSLKKKRELMGLLDGYSEAKGIVEKRQELEDAISFLEQLIPASGDK